jgi:putative Holliday junction resolvase
VRIMALDIGSKRIGVAMSDELLLTAQGRETIRHTTAQRDIAEIARLVKEEGVIEVVLGLPLNMNGTQSANSKEVLEFAAALAGAISVPVKTWDERLTTVGAEKALLEADMSRLKRKKLNDMVAAQLILQGYLDSLKKR